jgi:hypothetical protein
MSYKNGKIYKIEPVQEHEEHEIYVGSTFHSLSDRLSYHKSAYRSKCQGECRVFSIFDKYGLNNCKIELIENFPCESREELLCRESHFFKTLKCVNKNNPFVTIEQSKERVKKWYLEHIEHRKIYMEEYTHKNYDVLREKNLEYKKLNKEKLAHQQLETHMCLCGKTYTQCNRKRHFRTRFHIENSQSS